MGARKQPPDTKLLIRFRQIAAANFYRGAGIAGYLFKLVFTLA
jgi:hypothetical protein